MRAILAFATSLLALLLTEGQGAYAAPTGGSLSSNALDFGNVLVRGAAASLSDTATINGGAGTTLAFGVPNSPFGGGGQSVAVTNNTSQSLIGNFTFAPLITGAAAPESVLVTDTGTPVTQSIPLNGTGVAPLQTIATSSNPYVLIGQSGPVSLTIRNVGNGNLSGAGTNSNLRGTVSAPSNSVFVGSAASFSLGDTTQPTTPASATFGYTFTPTAVGAASTTVTATFANGLNASNAGGSVVTTLNSTGVAPIQSVIPASTSNVARIGTTVGDTITVANVGNANLAGTGTAYNLNGSVTNTLGAGVAAAASNQNSISLASNATASAGSTASTTLGYTYTPISHDTSSSAVTVMFSNGNAAGTNLSQSVSTTWNGTGVGPVFASSIQGASVTNTPAATANGVTGAASSTIAFGNVRSYSSKTVFLELDNTTNDPGAASLTNLTIERYALSNPGSFSVALASNSIIAENGQLLIPITVVTSSIGALNSTLTIFTDESAGVLGTGDTFTYALTALSVPEPVSLVALTTGLAGLAGVRRRRRAALSGQSDPQRLLQP